MRVSGQGRVSSLRLAKSRGSSIQAGGWPMAQGHAGFTVFGQAWYCHKSSRSSLSLQKSEKLLHVPVLPFLPLSNEEQKFCPPILSLGIILRICFRLSCEDGAIITWNASS